MSEEEEAAVAMRPRLRLQVRQPRHTRELGPVGGLAVTPSEVEQTAGRLGGG